MVFISDKRPKPRLVQRPQHLLAFLLCEPLDLRSSAARRARARRSSAAAASASMRSFARMDAYSNCGQINLAIPLPLPADGPAFDQLTDWDDARGYRPMSDLEKMAAQLSHFLKLHNIDAEDVNVVFRAKDEKTFGQMKEAIRLDLKFLKSHANPTNARRFKLYGIQIALGSLDYSR
jgi:hypothetical protein